MKKTKIVCTLGPASCDPAVLEALARAGMDVARLNFSHGSHDDHAATFALVRETAARTGREIAILQDLQGPKIRVGLLAGGALALEPGARVSIAPGERHPKSDVIPTTYAALARDVRPGDRILLDDGLLRLRVEEVVGERVGCTVEVGGVLKDRKGINLPGVEVSAPALTEKDLEDLAFGVELGVDFVCLSFVRSPGDVELARARIQALGGEPAVIAKIEKPRGLERLEAILDVADGIMVARGDLGVELGPEKVPLAQKDCIEAANRRGKLVITATQMLESMVKSAFPTRAEASDVANAVLDQTDAVMLSAETASGAHPALVVETMARIIAEVERSERYRRLSELPPLDMAVAANALSHAAAAAAASLPEVKAILCVSAHGLSPRLLSDYRPRVPIFALTGDETARRRLAAFWGIEPLAFAQAPTTEETLARAEAVLVERGHLSAGDVVIVTMAVPPARGEHTNTLKLHVVGHAPGSVPVAPLESQATKK